MDLFSYQCLDFKDVLLHILNFITSAEYFTDFLLKTRVMCVIQGKYKTVCLNAINLRWQSIKKNQCQAIKASYIHKCTELVMMI